MKHSIRYTGSALIVAGALACMSALAEDKPATPKLDPQTAAQMKKAEELGKPAAGHQTLEPLVGEWEAEVKIWMDPKAPPTTTRATATSKWVLGGRFVQEEFRGEFMGKPFTGMSLTGYDNSKKKYVNVWLDDMHTSLFSSEGAGNDASKVITFEGRMDCPITEEKDVLMKQVIRVLSRDKHVFEMHDTRQGQNSKTMEITYTRR